MPRPLAPHLSAPPLAYAGEHAALALLLDRAHRAAESIGAVDYTVKAVIYVVRDGVPVTVLGPAMGQSENARLERAMQLQREADA